LSIGANEFAGGCRVKLSVSIILGFLWKSFRIEFIVIMKKIFFT